MRPSTARAARDNDHAHLYCAFDRFHQVCSWIRYITASIRYQDNTLYWRLQTSFYLKWKEQARSEMFENDVHKRIFQQQDRKKTSVINHSKESYWALRSCGTVYYVVQGGSTFLSLWIGAGGGGGRGCSPPKCWATQFFGATRENWAKRVLGAHTIESLHEYFHFICRSMLAHCEWPPCLFDSVSQIFNKLELSFLGWNGSPPCQKVACMPMDETLVCDHSNESYWAVLSCMTVSYAVKEDCNFQVCCWEPCTESVYTEIKTAE